jgi:hypothetical protein
VDASCVGRHTTDYPSGSGALVVGATAHRYKYVAHGWDGSTGHWLGNLGTKLIVASEIAAGAVVADSIAANAITAGKIAALAVTAGTIAVDAVTAGTIAANAVTAGKVDALAITAGNIATDAIIARHILAGTISTDKLNTANYTEDGTGLPLTGATLSSNGTALKVAFGSVQMGYKATVAWGAGPLLAAAVGISAVSLLTGYNGLKFTFTHDLPDTNYLVHVQLAIPGYVGQVSSRTVSDTTIRLFWYDGTPMVFDSTWGTGMTIWVLKFW